MSLGRGDSRLKPQVIGELGERIAREWLWARGCKVLYRNFRAPRGGEVDIVARDGRMLCFIEVKTRTRRSGGRPADAVDRAKQELIERGAREWLRLLKRNDIPCRYDIIEVLLIEGERPEVTHLRNAF
ncbi:YraN family protein [Roseibacillus persicicus]|uniref:YraN family protein n=1 Tax=Roseibacillus persicicus TaxID=454148 RepID=UPI00398BAA89